MLGEVALSKLTDNALAMSRALPTIIYVKTSFHHVTLEKFTAFASAIHEENYPTHIIQFVRYVNNLVGNL